MTHKRIFEAYKALLKLSQQDLPLKEAWGIAKLIDKLRPFWDFQMQEERKFLDKCEWTNTDGGIEFKKAEDAEAFSKHIDEIMSLEDSVEFEPVKLSLSNGAKLSAHDIAALDGFAEFTEGA